MENSGGGDDQGSGWFEVKKVPTLISLSAKFYSSSFLTVGEWVEGDERFLFVDEKAVK